MTVFPPNTRFEYSNIGMKMLDAAIEQVLRHALRRLPAARGVWSARDEGERGWPAARDAGGGPVRQRAEPDALLPDGPSGVRRCLGQRPRRGALPRLPHGNASARPEAHPQHGHAAGDAAAGQRRADADASRGAAPGHRGQLDPDPRQRPPPGLAFGRTAGRQHLHGLLSRPEAGDRDPRQLLRPPEPRRAGDPRRRRAGTVRAPQRALTPDAPGHPVPRQVGRRGHQLCRGAAADPDLRRHRRSHRAVCGSAARAVGPGGIRERRADRPAHGDEQHPRGARRPRTVCS